MESGQFFFLTLTFILLKPWGLQCSQSSVVYTSRKDQRLAVTPVTSVTFTQGHGKGMARCVVWCKGVANCKSVNHKWDSATSSVTCEALAVYFHEVAGGTTVAAGWNFMQKDPVLTTDSMYLAFRATSGNGVSVYDTWMDAGRHDNPQDMKACVLPLSSSEPCTSHFRSYILDIWTNTDRVKVALYKNDAEVAQVTFDGKGSDMTSWFNQSRVLTSSWSDMTPTVTTNFFSLFGLQKNFRRFYLSRLHNSCPGDIGWMVVADVFTTTPTGTICSWEVGMAKPALLYMPYVVSYYWAHQDIADYMMVYVSFL